MGDTTGGGVHRETGGVEEYSGVFHMLDSGAMLDSQSIQEFNDLSGMFHGY